MSSAPREDQAHRFPVSVEGVVIPRGKVVLLRNERDVAAWAGELGLAG